MEFEHATNDTCHQVEGVAVVIDVLRAFSTAAHAFGAGAEDILLAGSLEEAFALQSRFPEALLMGEMDGLPVEGFHFSNSPAALQGVDLRGRRLIQRTSAGTQGMVRSGKAEILLAGSLLVASATARYLQKLNPKKVTFVITGAASPHYEGQEGSDFPHVGEEDMVCADFMQAVLEGRSPDPQPYLERVRRSPWGIIFSDPTRPEFDVEDLNLCAQVDTFDFAMQVRRDNGLLIMEKVV
jgi:2-phosphosulfolactate phosphatase